MVSMESKHNSSLTLGSCHPSLFEWPGPLVTSGFFQTQLEEVALNSGCTQDTSFSQDVNLL